MSAVPFHTQMSKHTLLGFLASIDGQPPQVCRGFHIGVNSKAKVILCLLEIRRDRLERRRIAPQLSGAAHAVADITQDPSALHPSW